MRKSLIVRYGVFGVTAGLGCLAVAYGFDAMGQAGLQEAIFRSDVYYRDTVAWVHCGATSPKFAANGRVPVQ
jgi:hypothetical protein